MRLAALALLPVLLLPELFLIAPPAAAQQPLPADAYRDEAARELVRLARARRAVVDTRITAYEVTAHERMSARMAVAGVERLIFRRETAARIEWTRDTVRVELLGAREAQPLGAARPVPPPPDVAGLATALAFDPVDSEMLFRFDSTAIGHPLAAGSEAHYRFASGDTTTLRLPDGRQVRLLELRVAARRADHRLINGSLWLDAATHGVVRAAFRLARAHSTAGKGLSVLLPEAGYEIDHVAIEFGLWEMQWWLPRTIVARGVGHAAGVRFPLAYERRYGGYRVVGDTLGIADAAGTALPVAARRHCRPRSFGSIGIVVGGFSRDSAWDAGFERAAARIAAPDTTKPEAERCDRAFVVRRAEGVDLVESPVFGGSIFEPGEATAGDAEMQELARLLERIPRSPLGLARPSIRVLTPELTRYNHVEGLSIGARAVLPLGAAELSAELRAGATGEVGGRLAAARATTRLRTELAGYRGVEAVDVASQPHALTSTLGALLLGRDENDYFRATGAELRLSPPLSRSQWWQARLYAERQAPLRTRAGFSVRGLIDRGHAARENLEAEAVGQAGAALRLRGARGDDPTRLRTHAELELLGETGDRTFARPLLRLGAERPLVGGVGAAVALAGGAAFGEVPLQRQWQIGGATTVRGHDPAAMRGESLWLARAELNRGSPALRLALFADAGWAGERSELWEARPLRGVGVGVGAFGGLLRVEAAHGVGGGGFRLHLRLGGGL